MSIPQEIKHLADRTGNAFHAKVVRTFREKQWAVQVSPYYLDHATNKAREVDLVVARDWEIPNIAGKQVGTVVFNLFVECKYVSLHTLFWFDKRDDQRTARWLEQSAGIKPINSAATQHHYSTSEKVAKLFASKRSGEGSNDPIYKAINQAIHSLVYLPRPRLARPPEGVPIKRTIDLPVLVVDSFDKFFRVEMDEPGEPAPIEQNFQLEVNYAYADRRQGVKTQFFLIDVVSLKSLSAFLQAMETDARAVIEAGDYHRRS